MAQSQPGFFKRIARFVKGVNLLTALSASRLNEIVDLLNAVAAIDGKDGIRVLRAAAGYTIVLDDPTLRRIDQIQDPGSTPTTGVLFQWKGEWTVGTTYVENDIVIHRSSAAIDDGTKAGTYMSLVNDNTGNQPFEAALASQTHWRTVAKGAWDILVISDGAGTTIAMDSTLKKLEMIGPAGWGSVKWELTQSGVTGTGGHDLEIRELDYCDAGVVRKIRVNSSAVYNP